MEDEVALGGVVGTNFGAALGGAVGTASEFLALLLPMQPLQSNMYLGSKAFLMASRRASEFVP